ncbi:MAG: cation diffusion facilitator family transporter [Bacteroidales bacterium]|nr:cation diffusion facilitator family transporter [Bacteroidales bacterium]
MQENREIRVIRAGKAGVAVNVLLAAFKAVVGLMSGSIAILMDAVHTLSDALSAVITMAGVWLDGKKKGRGHVFENISAAIVAVMLLSVGIAAGVSAWEKIVAPAELSSYSAIDIVIISVAIVAKLLLGRHYARVGREVGSIALSAAAVESLADSAISAATLVSAGIMLRYGIDLDGYFGMAIAAVVVAAAVKSLWEILGASSKDDAGGVTRHS